MREDNVAHNPIIRGFAPDPSITRCGEDYFLATSTFEYFPGIRLHRSRDLTHWEVVGHALDESNAFDLSGVPDSGGVWAPSLTWVDGEFWLAYSVVRTMDGDDKDLGNYLVTAPDITGPWSTPIYLGSRGFDFSFFHDDDGRHWVVGVQWDQRPGKPRFSGIVVEEYFAAEQRTSGDAIVIYRQDELCEGPNLYHIGDWYYLLLAEGGTGWNHGVTLARSRSLLGPYQRDVEPAMLTRRDKVGAKLQKAGHGELVETPAGDWYMVHLASRPAIYGGARYSILGRETCLQAVEFDDEGWLRVASGFHGSTAVPVALPPHPTSPLPTRDDFDADGLDRRIWATLRTAVGPHADMRARKGWLRLRGGKSTGSAFGQSTVLQRVTELSQTFETRVEAHPATSRQGAGLILWYDRNTWIWLRVSTDTPADGASVRVYMRDRGTTSASEPVDVADGPLIMRCRHIGGVATFELHDEAAGTTTGFPQRYPAWKLSDDYGDALRFTGMFAGIHAEDLDGVGWHADFDYFETRRDVPEQAGRALSARPA